MASLKVLIVGVCSFLGCFFPLFLCAQPYLGEHLSRGLVGIPSEQGMYLSWRMLYEDENDIAFDVYRQSNGGNEIKLNQTPIQKTTDFLDREVDWSADNRWSLRLNGREVASWSHTKNQPRQPYLSVPIDRPEASEVAGTSYSYMANDASVGDLDGDGEYEIVLKWNPSNAKNPPQRGFAGNTYLDGAPV